MNRRERPSGFESSPRRRYHFHAPGLIYILVTLFLAIGALNSQNNLLFASLGLAIGGLLVSGVLSGGSLMGVRIERRVEAASGGRVHVGGMLRFRYRLRNRNLILPAFGLTISELESGEEPEAAATWPGHIARPIAFVPHVPARGESEGTATVEAKRRGKVTFQGTRAWTTFPFGLAKKSVTVGGASTVVVHPVELPVRKGVLERLTVRSMTGSGAAPVAGTGDEFYGVREYRDGDNPRWIAWRRSARTGQVLVRQNTTPSPRKLWIVLRLSPDATETGVETAIAVASALVRACVAEGAAVGLAIPSHGVVIPPRVSVRGIGVMLDRLAELEVSELGDAEFPAGAVRSGANVVVHAGAIERSFGTSRTIHLGDGSLDRVLLAGQALNNALALLARTGNEQAQGKAPRGRAARGRRAA